MMMSPNEAIEVRNKLGLSIDALAAELGLTPHVVHGWETGKNRIPSKIAGELRWRAAVIDRRQALAASGLPECDWMSGWDGETVPDKMEARTAHLERALEHQKSCSRCQAREQFVVQRFGEMPHRPMAWWMEGLAWIASRIEKWPAWVQPAAWIGMAFGAYSLIRIVFMLPAITRNPSYVLSALGGLLLSISIGVAIGLAYGGFKALRSRSRARDLAQ